MKWASFAVPVLAASSAFAHSKGIVSARQAHVERGLLDICISINGDLNLLNILPGGKPLVFVDLDTCLCLGALPTFVNAFLQVKGGIAGVTSVQIVSALSAYVLAHPGKENCDFPTHCQPHGNNGGLFHKRGQQGCSDPCGFDCDDGYTAVGKKCVCLWPKRECNGQCSFYPAGCGASQAPKPWKRNIPVCSPGRDLCGVSGGSKGKGWECIDTKTDLESCGGCVVPSPFGNEVSSGKDCSSIPHALTVSCVEGGCQVTSCANGLKPSTSSDSCIPL